MNSLFWRAAAMSTGLLAVALAIRMIEVLGWGERTNLATIGSVVRILRTPV